MRTSLGTTKAPYRTHKVAAVGKTPNAAGDRTGIMRAPRLKVLATRNYGKPQTYDPKQFDDETGFGGM